MAPSIGSAGVLVSDRRLVYVLWRMVQQDGLALLRTKLTRLVDADQLPAAA